MCDQNERSFLAGLIIGGTIGALLVFLFGTDKGKKIRKELKEKGADILDDLDDILDEIEEKGKELKRKTEKIKEEVTEKASEFKEKAGEEVMEKLNDTLVKIENLQERGCEATAALRKKYFLKAGKSLG